jgi:hypothetical protein
MRRKRAGADETRPGATKLGALVGRARRAGLRAAPPQATSVVFLKFAAFRRSADIFSRRGKIRPGGFREWRSRVRHRLPKSGFPSLIEQGLRSKRGYRLFKSKYRLFNERYRLFKSKYRLLEGRGQVFRPDPVFGMRRENTGSGLKT